MKINKKGLLFSVAAVLSASLFASSSPDALERIAINYGFEKNAKETNSFFTDYSVPFINNEFVSTFLAGIIGLALLYLLYKAAYALLKKYYSKAA